MLEPHRPPAPLATRLSGAVASAALATALATAGSALAQPISHPDFVLPDASVRCSTSLRGILDAIDAPGLAADIGFLASPALEGRGLGSAGLEVAAEYVTAAFRRARLRPAVSPAASASKAGDPASAAAASSTGPAGSYQQMVPLQQVLRPGGALVVRTAAGTTTLRGGKEAILPTRAPQVLRSPVVFAGYGIREAALGRDDLAGLDVRGKAVLILGGLPPGRRWQAPELVARYASEDAEERYAARLETLGAAGATTLIALEDDLPRALAREPREAPCFVSPERDAEDAVPALVRISTRDGHALLAAAGLSAAPPERLASTALPGVEAELTLHGELQATSARNIIGLLEGSDPQLREQAVVIGAHVDHLGRVAGEIHPGADDNASGVAALLAMARAMAASPEGPRRTVIFAAWTGEEVAHFGSRHYVRHPAWPLAKTVAYLNLDMIGHPWTQAEIDKLLTDAGLPTGKGFLQGLGPEAFAEPGIASWAAAELGPVLARAGSLTGLALHLDRTDGRHGGSDYRSFARLGIPFVRFFGSFFPDYHKPGDSPDRLDTLQVQRVARLACATAWQLANP